MNVKDFIFPLREAVNFSSEVGGKALELSKLTEKGFPVPQGFIVSARIFEVLDSRLLERLEEKLSKVDIEDTEVLEAACQNVRDKVVSLVAEGLSEQVETQIALGFSQETGFAVRSSCIGEDGEVNSFAGEHDTYLWMTGTENIVTAIKNCWASMFNTRAVIYRRQRSLPVKPMAVLVQQMINSESSGVMMTLNPQNGDQSVIAIESIWGLGELIVSGSANPDLFLLRKINGAVISKSIVEKSIMMRRASSSGVEEVSVNSEKMNISSLSDERLEELYQLAKLTINSVEFRNIDIEFAFDEKLWVLQVRPETYWSSIKAKKKNNDCNSAMKLILNTLASRSIDEQPAEI